jgi:hypothetical protein
MRIRRSFLQLLSSWLVFIVFTFVVCSSRATESAYHLMAAGCVKDDIPFFPGTPDTIRRKQAPDGGIEEERHYDRSSIRTHSSNGTLLVEEIIISEQSVPQELKPIFELSLSQFLLRFGFRGERGASEYSYGEGYAIVTARFRGQNLFELKWSCGHD